LAFSPDGTTLAVAGGHFWFYGTTPHSKKRAAHVGRL
jgi:hypothetical protein